jgi:hypothetical protein
MKSICLLLLLCCTLSAAAQSPKTELYDLVRKLLYDSTGYENVGDWGVGSPRKYPVSWKADKIEMSNDPAINFYRMGSADVTLKGKSVAPAGNETRWNIMLKGPRMGYGSFSIISPASKDLQPKLTLDDLFGQKPFKAKLLKSCNDKPVMGYYYYEVKIPKKDMAYIMISWLTANGNIIIRLDGYDNYSKDAAKFECR